MASKFTAFMIVITLSGLARGQVVFEPPVSQAANVSLLSTHALAIGDVTGDGHLDVLVSDPFFGAVQLLVNDGLGLLSDPVQVLNSIVGADSLTLVDLDGDGLLDFVAQRTGDVIVAMGDGEGDFGMPAVHSIFANTQSVTVGDLTGDGLPDIVAAGSGLIFGPGMIYVLPGLGDGSFDEPQTLLSTSAGYLTVGLPVVGDVDGDGRDDVVAIVDNLAQSNHVKAFLSMGEGQYVIVDTTLEGAAGSMALADFDGDGLLDLVYEADDPHGSVIRVALGDGSGLFGPSSVIALPGSGPRDLVVADFDGDGQVDVATANLDSDDVSVLLGNGDGTLGPGVIVSGIGAATGLSPADLDGDGFIDLVALHSLFGTAGVDVLLNHTYGPDEPFTDLGDALATPAGYPIQLVDGTLQPGTPVSFRLTNADPGAQAWFIVGFSAHNIPFHGGTVVPSLDLVLGPFPLVGPSGLEITGTWPPAVPAGVSLWTQFWLDSGSGLGASSAVLAVTP